MSTIANSRVKPILRLNDRVFLVTLLAQMVIGVLIFSAFVLAAIGYHRKEASTRIEATFSEFEKRVTEAAYVEFMLKGDIPRDLPVVREIRSSLESAGIKITDVFLSTCKERPGTHAFSLKVGDHSLSKCLVIVTSGAELLEQIGWASVAGVLSLLLIGFVWLFVRRQITKKVLQPLVQTIEEENRRSILGEIAAQVAHDIRSPLSALNIVAMSSSELSQEKRTLLTQAVRRIDGIAQNLLRSHRALAVANPPQQKTNSLPETESEPIPVVRLFNSIVSEKLELHKSNQIELLTEGLDGSEAWVGISPTELERVLSNLLDNALEVSGDKIIRCKVKELSGAVSLSIEDRGPGFPKQVLQRLGQPGNTFGKLNGNGLGLYHAYATAHAIGGEVEVTSNAHGSQVVVTLPTKPHKRRVASRILPQTRSKLKLRDKALDSPNPL